MPVEIITEEERNSDSLVSQDAYENYLNRKIKNYEDKRALLLVLEAQAEPDSFEQTSYNSQAAYMLNTIGDMQDALNMYRSTRK